MRKIRFTYSRPGPLRRHYLNEEDVRVLLSRLPAELWERLRAVHFNDQARGKRVSGYVNMGRREIAICALPERVSMNTYVAIRKPTTYQPYRTPGQFGAARGRQWPELAVRRYQLYNTFLHELGHLQIIEPKARSVRRKFAGETKARGICRLFARGALVHAIRSFRPRSQSSNPGGT